MSISEYGRANNPKMSQNYENFLFPTSELL